MPGAYLWAWSEDDKKFIKVKVDAEGRFRTVNEVDTLGSIGDVTLTDIANNDVIYWDATASKWKNIAHLGDADAHHADRHKDTHDPIDGADKLDTFSGLSARMTAGAGIVFPVAVYAGANGKMEKALATSAATMPCIALAMDNIDEDTEGAFLMQGFFRLDAIDWTPGGLLYVNKDTAGMLTQTLPAASGEQVQVVGVAITTHIIYFNPSYELVEIS